MVVESGRISTGVTALITYMGTKRSLSAEVRDLVAGLQATGLVADLFSGMGSVAEALADTNPVLVNDALEFTGCFARVRFLPTTLSRSDVVPAQLLPTFLEYRRHLQAGFSERIETEDRACREGWQVLREYMRHAPHVGNDEGYRKKADAHRACTNSEHCMTSLYFASGYFSIRQCIDFDALRKAIELIQSLEARDRFLAAWLATASRLINSPGHTAQYLKPTGPKTQERILRQWRRQVWGTFVDALDDIASVGSRTWRSANQVTSVEALQLLASDLAEGWCAVYADPPYTKDHYSRYYHVYESMYLYDYPDSSGEGRYRSHRLSSPFSLASRAAAAFRELFELVAARGIPLVLSYPDDGLLFQMGTSPKEQMKGVLNVAREHALVLAHSTLGASSGACKKPVTERLYVCTPA